MDDGRDTLFEHRRVRGRLTWLFTTTSPLSPPSLAAAATTSSGVLQAIPGGTRTPYLAMSSAPCAEGRRCQLGVKQQRRTFNHDRWIPSHLVLMDVQASELLKLLSAGRSAGAAAKGGAGESGAGVAQHVVSGKLHSRVISTTKKSSRILGKIHD